MKNGLFQGRVRRTEQLAVPRKEIEYLGGKGKEQLKAKSKIYDQCSLLTYLICAKRKENNRNHFGSMVGGFLPFVLNLEEIWPKHYIPDPLEPGSRKQCTQVK